MGLVCPNQRSLAQRFDGDRSRRTVERDQAAQIVLTDAATLASREQRGAL
jgi:hypothetical protein